MSIRGGGLCCCKQHAQHSFSPLVPVFDSVLVLHHSSPVFLCCVSWAALCMHYSAAGTVVVAIRGHDITLSGQTRESKGPFPYLRHPLAVLLVFLLLYLSCWLHYDLFGLHARVCVGRLHACTYLPGGVCVGCVVDDGSVVGSMMWLLLLCWAPPHAHKHACMKASGG